LQREARSLARPWIVVVVPDASGGDVRFLDARVVRPSDSGRLGRILAGHSDQRRYWLPPLR
jgi:hypothetical protein